MPNFASVTLAGHLGKDPVLRQTAGGESMCSFSVATTEKKKGQEDLTTWWRCTAWGRNADVITQYLKQGDAILVTGTPSMRPWVDQNGAQQVSLDVNVREFAMLGGRRDSATPAQAPAARRQAAPAAQAPAAFDDDIPF